ncbi:MAG: PaREP1 family protein [Nitrososphaerota archaeon]
MAGEEPEATALALPRVVVDELRERARRAGQTVEEFVLELLTKDEDPREAWRKYLEGARQLLERAAEELSRGDLRQAGEKVWGACALAVKAHAMARKGLRLESHADLWAYKNEVALELGSWVRTAFKLAGSMHVNFYEGLATREDVEDALGEVRRLVEEVAKSLSLEGKKGN